ncbi:MAG: autotransporter domain-containing protein [Alphaproteobacteria bacterium]|nr:autotransporter domain-containing protein [Alphaproteobacteria bacterium]
MTLGAQRLTLTAANDSFDGTISGTGGVTVAGGTETLSGSNTYTGRTIINLGATLALTGSGSIAASSGVTDNGTFDISSTTGGAPIKTLDGSGTVTLGARTLTLTAASETFNGTISGTGGVTVAAGTETLTASSGYTGKTTIASGASVILTGAGAIAASSEVADSGTFSIAGTTNGASIKTLSGAGTTVLGSKRLTITAGSTAFSGVISGTEGVTLAGGAQTFSGANTYTGGTAINSGATLALSGAGTIAASAGLTDNGTFDISGTSAPGASVKTLTGSGTVALGARALTITNAAGEFTGTIAGTGSVVISGGAQKLSGLNTYSGGTTVANATLTVNGNAALGAPTGSIALTNGALITTATLTANRATTLTGTGTLDTNGQTVNWNGVIGGTGSLTATGGGTLVLTGTNTYAGGTLINNHTTVSVCSDANLGAIGGALTVTDGTLILTCSFASNRTINLNGTGKIDTGGNAVDLTGNINLSAGNGAPVVLFTGTVHTTGSWTLDPINGLFISGTLSGNGTVNEKTTLLSGATLSPGASPGTITFAAPVVLLAGSTTAIDVDGAGTGTGAGNFDRIVVTGAGNTLTAGGQLVVKLRGITGAANNNFTPVVGQRFNVIHTTGGILGSYAGLTEPTAGLAAGTQFDAVYSDTDMDLVATPISYANLTPIGVTDTLNRVSLGAAINSYRLAPGVRMTGDRNPVLTALYSLPAGSIGASMDQIAGAVQGDVMNAALNLNRLFASASEDHRNGRSLMASAGRFSIAAGYSRFQNAAIPRQAQLTSGSRFWAVGMGSWTNTQGDGNAPGYVGSSGGLVAGVDLRQTEDGLFGFALGYGHANVRTKNAAVASAQSERFIAYGSLTSNAWHFDGELTVGINQFNSRRLIVIGALSRTANGNSSGWAFSADAAVHYGDGPVVPFAEARYDHIGRASFSESGAGDLNLMVAEGSIQTPRVLAGVDANLSRAFGNANPAVNVDLRLAWAHDFDNVDGLVNAALAGSPTVGFTAKSSRIGSDAGLVNAALSFHLDDAVSLFGEYRGEVRTRQTTQAATVGIRANW